MYPRPHDHIIPQNDPQLPRRHNPPPILPRRVDLVRSRRHDPERLVGEDDGRLGGVVGEGGDVVEGAAVEVEVFEHVCGWEGMLQSG